MNLKYLQFDLSCFPEDIPFVGNCSAVNDAVDSATENLIREGLEAGNEWSWCCVSVRVTHPDIPDVYGRASLGGCSYASEQDFRSDPYFADLKTEAYQDFLSKLENIKGVICPE